MDPKILFNLTRTANVPRRVKFLFITAILLSSISFRCAAEGEITGENCEREIVSSALKYDVPVAVLYAIGITESGGKNGMRPFALNIAGIPLFPGSKTAAAKAVVDAQRRGLTLIDVGCMQINIRYHGAAFKSLEEILDPKKNVDYAARFVRRLRVETGSWTMAVARYHAGPRNESAQKKYICNVIRNMVISGAGEWTNSAREFCS